MKTFQDFYTALKEDELWFEQASKLHKSETFESVARQVWVDKLAEGQFPPMTVIRRQVFNKVSKVPADRVIKKWYLKESDKVDNEKQEDPPLTGQARLDWLKKWEETVKASPVFPSTPRLTSQMIEEEGGVRPKAVQPYPATKPMEYLVHERHLEYIKQNYDAWTKEKLPNWITEEEFNELNPLV